MIFAYKNKAISMVNAKKTKFQVIEEQKVKG